MPIHDLCNAISTLQKPLLAAEYTKQVSLLRAKRNPREVTCLPIAQNALICPLKGPSANHRSRDVVSLSTVLNATALTREKRLLLGVILSSSILQLYQTSWLGNNWDINSVLFVIGHKRTMYDNPFVTWDSTDHLQGPDMASPVARTIRNWPLFRLGVVLIELWYGKPLDEITKPDGSQINMSIPSPILDWHRADCLVDELYMEAGKKYSDAVRRCIRCSFDTRVTSLDDPAFQKAVYEGVVAQLKENLDFLYQIL